MQKILRAHLGEYEAVLVQRRYVPEYDRGLWYGGSESQPRWVVQELSVRYKGRRIPLRRGVYADLAEVNSIRFTARQSETVLQVEGGDAADSYRMYLFFRQAQLTRRRVEDGEFPRNSYEETRYVRNPVED